jgi:hypothetical protein
VEVLLLLFVFQGGCVFMCFASVFVLEGNSVREASFDCWFHIHFYRPEGIKQTYASFIITSLLLNLSCSDLLDLICFFGLYFLDLKKNLE